MTKNFNEGEVFYSTAETAVKGFVNRKFRTFFTKEDVEDMVNDTVGKMWKARTRYDADKGEFGAWTATIARNVVLTAARSKARRNNVFCEASKSEEVDDQVLAERIGYSEEADAQFIADETEEGFFGVLTRERERRFLEWMLDGLDATEMARREGITLNNAYVVIHGLRKKLRNLAA